MSDFIQFPAPARSREFYLVGIRLDPTVEGPQFFTLLEEDESGSRPIMAEGRILFFSTPALATRALQRADEASIGQVTRIPAARVPASLPKQVDVMCDVAQSLFLVNSQAADADGVLLDSIACLDDLVRATQLNVPASYISALGALAERLEDNPEFGSFLDEQGIDRETVEDALLWCVGAVAAKSTWLG